MLPKSPSAATEFCTRLDMATRLLRHPSLVLCVRTLFAGESVEAGRTAALVSVHVGETEATVKADGWLDRARVNAVVDVAATHGVVDQLQITTVDRHLPTAMTKRFYPRDAMLARVGLLTTALCPFLSQVGVLSKGKNGLIWFWYEGFFRPVPHCVLRKLGYRQK